MRYEDKEGGRKVWRCLEVGVKENGEGMKEPWGAGEGPKPGSEACLPGSTIGPLGGRFD